MGGKAGKILPLIAMVGMQFIPGVLPAEAALFSGLTGAAAAAPVVAATAGAAAGAGASGGFFSSLVADFGQMSTLSKVGLGLSAVSGVGSMLSSSAAAQQQNDQLAILQGQQNLKTAGDNLDLANRSLAAEQRLRKTLSALNVRANAFGADLSSGSGGDLMNSAYFSAQNAMDPMALQQQRVDQSGRAASQIYAYKRRAVGSKRTGVVLGSLLNFGVGAAKTFSSYNKIGRA